MRARPELIGGEGATDTTLMRTLDGWIAKGGAEGLMAAASPDGLGIALEVEDGNSRALRPALSEFGGNSASTSRPSPRSRSGTAMRRSWAKYGISRKNVPNLRVPV